jgi:uncharacterized membrane protein YphA (DoxX/SURF4 family)
MKSLVEEQFWVLPRVGVGLVFAYAGWAKLIEPSANFEAALLKYGVFSPQWIPWLARIVPWLEWMLGSFLVVGYAPRLAAVGTSLLALTFLVTLTSSRLFLESGGSDCGCFGRSGVHLSLRQIFVVDLVSFVVALRLGFLERFPWTFHSFLVKLSEVGDDTKKKGKPR